MKARQPLGFPSGFIIVSRRNGEDAVERLHGVTSSGLLKPSTDPYPRGLRRHSPTRSHDRRLSVRRGAAAKPTASSSAVLQEPLYPPYQLILRSKQMAGGGGKHRLQKINFPRRRRLTPWRSTNPNT